jgi:hypothetical protein
MLKPEDMFAISEEINSRYAPVFSAKPIFNARIVALSPNELLEISQEISRQFEYKLKSSSSKLVLLPIDPKHLYVSWTLTENKTSTSPMHHAQDSEQLILRVRSDQNESIPAETEQNWYDIPLEAKQHRQQITIPYGQQANAFEAAIGTIDKHNQFTELATAKVTYNFPQGLCRLQNANTSSAR